MNTHPQLAAAPATLPVWTDDLTDADITAAIGTLLATKKGLNTHLVAVSTHDGLVTLTGFTDTLLARARAEEVALAVRGVRGVTSTVAVRTKKIGDAELQRLADGTIISRRLTKPSGVKSWDDAVLSAIDKTEVLPRDVDGRVPPVLIIGFRPRD